MKRFILKLKMNIHFSLILVIVFLMMTYQNCGQPFQSAHKLNLLKNKSIEAPQVRFASTPPELTNDININLLISVQTSSESTVKEVECHLDSASTPINCLNGFSYSGLQDGLHTVEVIATDNLGHSSEKAIFRWTVDATKPLVTLNSSPSDMTFDNLAQFSFTSTDNLSGINSTECSLDQASYNVCTSPLSFSGLSETSHTFKVRARDNAKNISTEITKNWTVSKSAPVITISNEPNSITNSHTATFTFSGTYSNGTPVAQFECAIDSEVFTNCSSPFSSSYLTDGSHSISIRAKNSMGAVTSSIQRVWMIDSIEPTIQLTATPTNPTTQTTAAFSFTTSDNPGGSGLKTTECALDNETYNLCTSPINYSGLTVDSHTFKIRVKDMASNQTINTFSWTVSSTNGGGGGGGGGNESPPNIPIPVGAIYISPSGNDSVSCIQAQSTASPRKTLMAGLSCLSSAGTLVLLDGTYSDNFSNLPNGSPNNYLTLRALNEGAVIINGSLLLNHTNSYIQIMGMRFHNVSKNILGNHLKFYRNEFKSGCATGNCVNTSVGTNDYNDTSDILLEDNWFHGSGGRYNLLIYNSNRVIIRRAVVRHDGGWTDTKGDPEAGINFYNSTYCSAQNVIILDSNLTYHTWQAAFYSVMNPSSPNSNNNNSWLGIVALNNSYMPFQMEGSQSHQLVQDAVLWGGQYGIVLGTGNSNITLSTINRVTLSGDANSSSGIATFASASIQISNVIINSMKQSVFDGVSATYYDAYNSGNIPTSGTGRLTVNPFTNGLLYLTQIEAGSLLKTAGSNAGQIGAQITYRIGESGTLYGETGWNQETNTNIWPFPYQDRIKKEMCTDAGISRGFCSKSSLSHYIWEYLGNTCPSGKCN